ncbi:venom serine carboxypeptidase-like [Rhopalosiphum maidis]|uniref:venom serine carboxypeptidase-like n=1 Tax=Rhopalosiphum maidis TaxID=43146 RepID=UPI000F00DBCC|nr:venom serine carboxypeptidase-like [Rhopalosiphum maidis]XP_060848011.1 venom serine carboxypeptidase-like [Rhopalosiphum padi]
MLAAFRVILACCAAGCCVWRRAACLSSESTPLYLRSAYPLWDPKSTPSHSAAEPLLLTPYLRNGNILRAKQLARVTEVYRPQHVVSYSGYFTVDDQHNSNLFFWFFPATCLYHETEAPLILWLEGGPGASTAFSVFKEIGPFNSSFDGKTYTIDENPLSWHNNNSLLFIDSPVGTGFSFTEHIDGYATNFTTVGEQLFEALTQFYTMFPEQRPNPFYIVAESYGGKFALSLASLIHNDKTLADIKIDGIAIGNGFLDPETLLCYGDFLYQIGLVDNNTKQEINKLESQGRKAIHDKHFVDAFYAWSGIMSTFIEQTQFPSLYNIIDGDTIPWNSTNTIGDVSYIDLLQTVDSRRALHIGDIEYTSLGVIYYKMIPDFMTSVKEHLEQLVTSYPILVYNGQMDLVVAYPLSVNLYSNMKSPYGADYKKAIRKPWYVDKKLAGYIKTVGNLTEVMVRNAGHLVSCDRPEVLYDLIHKFITKRLNQ